MEAVLADYADIMEAVLAGYAVSVAELERNFVEIMAQADGAAVAVWSHNNLEAYLIPAERYQAWLEYLEDLARLPQK